MGIARVTTGSRRIPGRRVLVARQLDHSVASDRQLHDVIRVRGEIKVTVEPPFLKRQERKRVLWTIGRVVGLVKAVHARVPEG